MIDAYDLCDRIAKERDKLSLELLDLRNAFYKLGITYDIWKVDDINEVSIKFHNVELVDSKELQRLKDKAHLLKFIIENA